MSDSFFDQVAVKDPPPEWYNKLRLALQHLTTNGTTANRPVPLWIGQPYFDTDLGFQIHWNGTVWVDGAGNPV